MNAFIKVFVLIFILFAGTYVIAQNDTLNLSTAQVEDIFIKQNLQLIAEKLNIDKAEVAIIQAKRWPNPSFTLDQVNFWSTNAQRQGVDEVIPPLFGSFGKNLEFGLGIDQIIQLGGKRSKLVNMEKISKDLAAQYFEELLCNLKTELRTTCADLRYSEQYSKVLKDQQNKLTLLITNYRQQVKQGNISQNQLLRLQAALLGVESELNDTQKEINIQQKSLKMLLNISSPVYIYITSEEKVLQLPESLLPNQLSDLAVSVHPEAKKATLQTDYYNKSILYEKSQRVPDLTLHAAYDRGGNCMLNFVGFGLSVDLPFFNRNQGGIKTAKIDYEKSLSETEYKKTEIRNNVILAFENYKMAYNFNRQITNDFISNLEEIEESYTRNFINKNIGIVEFLDFFDAYKENKRTLLNAQKEVRKSFEELQYAVGTELN